MNATACPALAGFGLGVIVSRLLGGGVGVGVGLGGGGGLVVVNEVVAELLVPLPHWLSAVTNHFCVTSALTLTVQVLEVVWQSSRGINGGGAGWKTVYVKGPVPLGVVQVRGTDP